jgi:DNA-binding SARP family transcriptional activator
MAPSDRRTGLHLRLLGHLSVSDARGRSILPRTRKTRALLAVLAMASPRPVLRVQLASLLWSRRGPEQARASLRQSVHELQDTLGPDWSHLFIADRHHLSLRGPGMTIDTAEIAAAKTVSAKLLHNFNERLLEDLDGLDPAFDAWLQDARARFARRGIAIGESVMAASEDPPAMIEAAELVLSIDRLHEGAWRAIIRSHAERGDLDAAIGCYERCRAELAEAGGGRRPSPETEDLIGRIRAQASAGPAVRQMAEPQEALGGAERPPRNGRTTLRVRVPPFRTLGEDRNDGLGIGLAEEISAGLSRFRWISCMAVLSWPEPAGGLEPDGGGPAQPWEIMDADMMLEGSIQHAPGRVRIIVRLLDLRASGEIVWAGRFDRELTDPLALQDELAATIVARIDPELLRHEGLRTNGAGQAGMTGQDLLLQALPGIYRMERESFLAAGQLLEASLRADPGNSAAHGWLAYWYLLYVGQGWPSDPAACIVEAGRLAERAVTLDPGDARALTLAGHVRGFLSKHPAEAIALHERALALNPNLALAWCFSGFSYSYQGDHDEALRRINQAIRLSPADPHMFFFDMALVIVQLMRGDFESAVEAGRRAIELNPLFTSTYKSYLSALGWAGRTREAVEVRDRLLTIEPGFSVQQAVERSPFCRPEDIDRYAEGLRRAGLA